MLGHERRVRKCEYERQPEQTEYFEVDPHVGADVPPDQFIEAGYQQEEDSPAQGEGAPCRVWKVDCLAHHIFYEQLAVIEPTQKQGAKEHVDQGHLDLDERVIMKPDREGPKDADKDGAEQGNLGNLSR